MGPKGLGWCWGRGASSVGKRALLTFLSASPLTPHPLRSFPPHPLSFCLHPLDPLCLTGLPTPGLPTPLTGCALCPLPLRLHFVDSLCSAPLAAGALTHAAATRLRASAPLGGAR